MVTPCALRTSAAGGPVFPDANDPAFALSSGRLVNALLASSIGPKADDKKGNCGLVKICHLLVNYRFHIAGRLTWKEILATNLPDYLINYV